MTMPSPTSLLLLLLLQTLLLLTTKTYSQNDPILTDCLDDTNYTIPSTFKTNLDLLLPNLTASALLSSSLFSTATVGDVHGLAQCRPDASLSDCSSCLNNSASAAIRLCPLRRSVAVRFDLCILRYSDQLFFSQPEETMVVWILITQNVSDQTVFSRRLGDLMDQILPAAAVADSKFGAGVIKYSDFGYIYGLAQCTRDLSDADCSECLKRAVDFLASCCYGKITGKVMKVSCYVIYDTQPIFSLSLVPPPPPSSTPPPPDPPPPDPPPPPPLAGNGSGSTGEKNNKPVPIVFIVIPVVAALVLLSACCIFLRRRKSIRRIIPSDLQYGGDKQEFRSAESLLYSLGTLRVATSNFSDVNKLGEGGFGPVYKGALLDGREIAVKRLSQSSGQGLVELRNEVVLVANLQHRNLVRLLGFCLEEQEKMLVYEYLPNTSLDKFLSAPIKRKQLDWGSRYKIIEGIGRGLLYLHEESRLRIIHRDLKASNILLDRDLNPKISDFGLAKLFGIDETHGRTGQIAGTYGYMAPEYAMLGRFSTKSDVFSYGVLVLEIVTGRRNSDFGGSGPAANLLSFAWNHWNDGAALHLRDPILGERCRREEVLRCIHIGLLCVQEDPTYRPSMASVILMLSSYSVTVPTPSMPAFFIPSSTTTELDVLTGNSDFGPEGEYSDRNLRQSGPFSANDMLISEMDPR